MGLHRIGPANPPGPGFSRDVFARFAMVMIRRRHYVVLGWSIAVLIGVLGLPHLLNTMTSPPSLVSGSEAARVTEIQATGLPALGNEQMILVLHSEKLASTDPRFRQAIPASMNALAKQEGISGQLLLAPRDSATSAPGADVAAPLRHLFSDAATAYVLVGSSGGERQRQDRVPAQHTAADAAAREASGGQVRAYLVGPPAFAYNVQRVEVADLARIELVAIPAAAVVLMLGLWAPIAALLPILMAGVAVISTLGIFALLSKMMAVDGTLLTGVTAVGLGTGIDYALFVVTRFREERSRGRTPERSAALAVTTSGRTVFYAGLIVIMAVTSLLMMKWPVFKPFTIGITFVIIAAMAASLTLLPAILIPLAPQVDWSVARRSAAPSTADPINGRLARWSRHLMRHPWPYAIGVTAMLVAVALPAAGLTLGLDMERRALAHTSYGAGMSIVENEVPGLPGGVTVLVQRTEDAKTAEPDLTAILTALHADPEVAAVTAMPGAAKDLTAILIIHRSPADSPEAIALPARIRDDILPTRAPTGYSILVGGGSAAAADIIAECAGKLWWIVGTVLLLMFAILAGVLRSVVLPLKALAMNLLATGAAFGLMVICFQWGYAKNLFGFDPNGSVWPQIPILVFVLLFAVSLDYELFLVRRIQEEYRATADNTQSVAAGMQRTARPITLAALIMVVAFGSLLFSSVTGLKAFGFTIAMALLIDATLIRLILVPAMMKIFGKWNWWFPFAAAHTTPVSARKPAPRRARHELEVGDAAQS